MGEWPSILPANYNALTPDEKRVARVRAVSRRRTPEEAIAAWHFFRTYYLGHKKALFYKEVCPSPKLHYELVSFTSLYKLNAIAAPRGTSKSTVVGIEYPLMELVSPSIPGLEIAIVLAKDAFVEDRFDKIMFQLASNERIVRDFGCLRPTKGEGIWNRHQLRLTNGAVLKGFSVEGRKRGARPDIIIIDDPEFDPDEGTNVSMVNANLETVLLREILGMRMPHTRVFWIGTLLHARSFLYRILRGNDPRYANWHRRIYTASASPDDLDTGLLWPERLTKDFLLEQLGVMGKGAWLTEYYNDPRSDTEAILLVDDIVNQYHLAKPDDPAVLPHLDPNPLMSPVRIRWNEVTSDLSGAATLAHREEEFGKHAMSLSRYMTVDYAAGEDRKSDYSALVIWGLDPKNTLWVLDVWQGKVRANELIKRIWQFGKKWGTRIVGIEAVSIQDDVRQQVADFMGLLAQTGEWTPRVRAIRYPVGVSKGDRIESLEWRFEKGRIKLPGWRKRRTGSDPMASLFNQIENFTPDLSRLPNDDLIDALSMAHYLLGSGGRPVDAKTGEPQTFEERLNAGELYLREYPCIPLLHAFSPCEWTPKMIELLEQRTQRGTPQHSAIEHANEDGPYTAPDDFDDFNPMYYQDDL